MTCHKAGPELARTTESHLTRGLDPPPVHGAARACDPALGWAIVGFPRGAKLEAGRTGMGEVKSGELRSVVEAVRQIVLDWD
jgi:hypothetical protein